AIIRSLIYIILNEIDDAHQKQNPDTDQETDKNAHILTQFKSLLSEHFIAEREVSFYADKLHLTPKYFSTLIREVSGKTAGAWINEMVLRSEEHTSELQSRENLVCRLLLEKKKK